jgi:hypothetical protein
MSDSTALAATARAIAASAPGGSLEHRAATLTAARAVGDWHGRLST